MISAPQTARQHLEGHKRRRDTGERETCPQYPLRPSRTPVLFFTS